LLISSGFPDIIKKFYLSKEMIEQTELVITEWHYHPPGKPIGPDGKLIFDYDIGEDSIPRPAGWGDTTSDLAQPSLGTIWDAIKGFFGYLWGPKGDPTNSTWVDSDGNLHAGQTWDFTDATVLGITGGGGTSEAVFNLTGPLEASESDPYPSSGSDYTTAAISARVAPAADVTVTINVNGASADTATLPGSSTYASVGVSVSTSSGDLVTIEVPDDADCEGLVVVLR